MKRIATIIIATLTFGGAQLAVADDEGTGVALSKTVQYTELDLAEPKAIEILHRRLSHAAEQVCAPLEGRELWKLREHRKCLTTTLSQAVANVDRPMLTQYHLGRNGATAPRVASR